MMQPTRDQKQASDRLIYAAQELQEAIENAKTQGLCLAVELLSKDRVTGPYEPVLVAVEVLWSLNKTPKVDEHG